jgi:hypothetical protein
MYIVLCELAWDLLLLCASHDHAHKPGAVSCAAGDARKDSSGGLLFEPASKSFKPWAPVQAAVGECLTHAVNSLSCTNTFSHELALNAGADWQPMWRGCVLNLNGMQFMKSLQTEQASSMLYAGDLPVFSQLLGDGNTRTPFKGPAALIGLDVLAQRRVVLEAIPPALARTVGRRRRLFVAKK